MGYLLPTEYVQYGLTAETTDDWVTMASALMEAYCRRPSLLVTQYVERMRLTTGSQAVRLSYRPLTAAVGAASALVGVRVRYARPRRGELVDTFREQVVWAFGLPGSWTALDVAMVDVNCTIGELTFPVNFLGLDYNEVEVTYTSGLAAIPDAVKVACVQIVKNAQATPSVNVKQTKIDTMWMTYFGSSLIDPQVQMLLKRYVAERLG
jgi:hypothetical protein